MTSLVKRIDKRVDEAAAQNKTGRELGTYVIFHNDKNGLDQELGEIGKKQSLQRVSLGIGVPPDRYEVSKDADMTVVIYNIGRPGQQKVVANFALRKGELDDHKADEILDALSKVLPK